ncbi:hypothetical protein D3C72_1195960 [compost metagenome]
MGSAIDSIAGRKRRSSAYTVSATMPSTVISPKVSKPRKSTSITLTTLVPPPSVSARSRKKGEMLCGKVRVIIAQASAAMPQPAMVATSRSRPRRPQGRSRMRAGCTTSLLRIGSQRRPSRMSTVVTASTTSCVSARSGAENQM